MVPLSTIQFLFNRSLKVGWTHVCRYVNASNRDSNLAAGRIYPTKEEAEEIVWEYAIDVVKIEWEE